MKNRSIGFRLTVWYAAVLSVGLVLFSVALRYTLAKQLHADLAASLQDQLLGFERYLLIEDQDPGIQLMREIDEYSRSMPWAHLLSVRSSGGMLVYSNEQTLSGQAKQSLMTAERTFSLREGVFQVRLGISREPMEHMLRRFTMLLVFSVPIFLCAGCVGGYWLSRRALRPVQLISDEAQSIGVNNLSERLSVPDTRDEIQKLAETWNEMLGRLDEAVTRIAQFTADASHELRTPLAVVRLSAEKALRRPRTEAEYRTALVQIQAETERMTALVEDLLYLARANTDNTAAGAQIVNVRGLVEAVCDSFDPIATTAGVTIERDFDCQPVSVPGDEAELRRLLTILLDNAVKYTSWGGRVRVATSCPEGRAVLAVSDTGIGIPSEARKRVFERFYRVDASRNKQSGGFGLGLSIAQAIARRHGTEIALHSEEGVGSTFQISFPVAGSSKPIDTLVGDAAKPVSAP